MRLTFEVQMRPIYRQISRVLLMARNAGRSLGCDAMPGLCCGPSAAYSFHAFPGRPA